VALDGSARCTAAVVVGSVLPVLSVTSVLPVLSLPMLDPSAGAIEKAAEQRGRQIPEPRRGIG
jgi:hypothetical protein